MTEYIKGITMAQVCPLAFRNIDGTIARLNAFSVSAVLLLFVISQNPLWLYILGVDFLIRIYGKKKFSPLFQISTIIKKHYNMETVMVDAGAKRVAAQLGLFFIFLLIVLTHLECTIGAIIVTLVFLSCTGLEVFFSYCIGCEIYFLLQKLR